MAIRWRIGVVVVASAWVAMASEPVQDPVRFRAHARVFIDESGAPQRVEPSTKLAAPVRALVEQRVLDWRFEPVIVDDQRKGGATYVFLDGCAVPRGDGTFDVAMEYDSHGPGPVDGELRRRPPAYPPAAMRAGDEGSFRIVLKVGIDGSAEVESIESIKGNLRPFREALRAWAASARYIPEEVDGVPVSSRTSIRTDFWLPPPGQVGRDSEPATCEAMFEDAMENRAITLDSPFKLLRKD